MSFKEEWNRCKINDLKRTTILKSLGSGCNNILVTAIHNKTHYRNGGMKVPEPQTETMVKMLNIKNDCWGLYKESSDYEDANRDEICNTKNEIYALIKEHREIQVAIHLHQLKRDKDTDIDICCGNCNNLDIIEICEKEISNMGFKATQNKYFSGKGENNLGDFLTKTFGIPSISLEINSKNIWYWEDEKEGGNMLENYDGCQKIFDILSNITKEISRYIKQEKGVYVYCG